MSHRWIGQKEKGKGLQFQTFNKGFTDEDLIRQFEKSFPPSGMYHRRDLTRLYLLAGMDTTKLQSKEFWFVSPRSVALIITKIRGPRE